MMARLLLHPHLSLGLGTLGISPEQVPTAISSALSLGYRRIDCAPVYFNEDAIGDALAQELDGSSSSSSSSSRTTTLQREQLYITSKLASPFHRREHVKIGLQKTLTDLRLDYLDLYLVHWPQAFYYVPIDPLRRGYDDEGIDDSGNGTKIDPTVSIHETWAAMEELVDEGLVRNIGVSNFPVSLLHELMTQCRIPPAVNQVEAHPYLQQTKLLRYCQKRGVHFQAYSPLGSPGYKEDDEPTLLEDPVLKAIAATHHATVAQVCLAWALQRGTSVVAKSATPLRQQENWSAVATSAAANSAAGAESCEAGTCLEEETEMTDYPSLQLSDLELQEIATLERGYRFFRPEEWWDELGMAVFN